MKSLFGDEIPDTDPVKIGGKRAIARPAPIGSGPAGERCGTCRYVTTGGRPRFKKCELNAHNHSHGPGTDIKMKHAACKFWEAKDEESN